MPRSWFSPKTVKKRSPVHGRGLFACRAIAKGEVVAVKGGHVYGERDHQRIEKSLGPVDVQVGDGLYIGPRRGADESSPAATGRSGSCSASTGRASRPSFWRR